MSVSSLDAAWQAVDERVGSVLQSLEECMAELRTEVPDPRRTAPVLALAGAADAELDHDRPLRLASLETLAGRLLPADTCRLLRMMPIALPGQEGTLKVLVDSPEVELLVSVLQRHPRTRDAGRYDFVVVSPDELESAIALFHRAPQLPAPRPRDLLDTWEEVDAEVVGELPPAPVEVDEAELFDAEPFEVESVEAEPFEVEPAELAPAPLPLEPLGLRLLADGVVTEAQLHDALSLQERWGGRLGEVLVDELGVDETAVASVLADQLGLELIDLDQVKVSPEAIDRVDESVMAEHRVLPLRIADGSVVVATVDPLDEDAVLAVHEATGLPVHRLVVSAGAHDRALQRLFGSRHLDRAINALREERPDESAVETFTGRQKLTAAVIALICLIGVAIAPVTAFVALNIIAETFYLTFAGYRLKLIYNSLARDVEVEVSPEDLARLDERRLPVFTLLVPLYREAAVIPQLAAGIQGLDYPKTKLDVKLICEADDSETIEAIERLGLPRYFHLVVVPDAQPKTKPKACNYALQQARGELVVIYDAEDRPDPDQLKRVVLAFADSDPHVVCVQCKLSYFNREQNLLTRWFTTEYSMWFDLFLPGLDSVDAPIPLGGTSNHFVTEQLRKLGGWDPFNVTEDADLGIRLSRSGYRTTIVDSTTYEEANPLLSNWIRQRSRWVKGYIQTWLVHMRHPLKLGRRLGWRRFWSFQFVVGGTFIGFLLNPLYWALTTLWFLTEAGLIREIFPGFLFYVASVGLYLGNFVFMYVNAAGAMWRGYDQLVKYALFTPAYWGLMSIAAWKGVWQLFTKPHYWEKTIHGLADQAPPDPAELQATGGEPWP